MSKASAAETAEPGYHLQERDSRLDPRDSLLALAAVRLHQLSEETAQLERWIAEILAPDLQSSDADAPDGARDRQSGPAAPQDTLSTADRDRTWHALKAAVLSYRCATGRLDGDGQRP